MLSWLLLLLGFEEKERVVGLSEMAVRSQHSNEAGRQDLLNLQRHRPSRMAMNSCADIIRRTLLVDGPS